MNKEFSWANLPQPFFVAAPLADVTDVSFRQMFARHGLPHALWTEFVSADGLFLARDSGKWAPLPECAEMGRIQDIAEEFGIERNNPLLLDLLYFENERPIIVQFFSTDPGRMERAAALGQALGFDGVDLNMGCPADVICKQGSGAAMIKTPKLARELIRAAQKGATEIPVSVKTRIGFNEPELEAWVSNLLEEKINLLTLHARTRKQMSKVPAEWSYVGQAVELRNRLSPETLIVGNGDVTSIEEGKDMAEMYKADGVMVGRGIFGNPWFFTEHTPTPEERLKALHEHATLFGTYLIRHKSFALMKKHVKAYVSGWDGARNARDQIMQTDTLDALLGVVETELERI